MGFESILRTDILDRENLVIPDKVEVEHISYLIYQKIKGDAYLRSERQKVKSPGNAKNIVESLSLIKQAIEDYEKRTHVTESAKVNFTYEYPDSDVELEAISAELTRREPGMFGQGRPFENDIKQLRPILREEKEDPDNPGYKRAVLGYCYDNIVTLTCWARTNKAANDRALWLENVMEEYTWFFVYSGVNRIFYQGRKGEKNRDVSNQKIYGRSIDFYIRTEKLRSVSQKELEKIAINMGIATKG